MNELQRNTVTSALAVMEKHGLTAKRPTITESVLERLKPPARLIFGLDLTASREAGLKQARIATASMFKVIKSIGRIEVKLAYYRGQDEIVETEWCGDAAILQDLMLNLSCEPGSTKIGRLLKRAIDEPSKIAGVIFIGDHNEDSPEQLMELASVLGRRSIPIFVFHEYNQYDVRACWAQPVFQRVAEASGGVYLPLNSKSATALREILAGVAAFSIAGTSGMERLALPRSSEAKQLHKSLRLMLGPGGK